MNTQNTPVDLVNSEWQEIYTHQGLVLVYCWAHWCIRSQNLIPLLDRLTEEHEDCIKVIMLNIDEDPKTASELGLLGINSIPVTFIFKAGKCLDKILGNTSYETFRATIRKYLTNDRSVH
jgi:thioredoxin 1